MNADRQATILAALVVFLAGSAVFLPSISNEFLDFDDEIYVTGNEVVQQGVTLRGILWAFTNTHSANWQPLTWLSHMLDVQIFRLDPRGHHATNILFHALNSALVFLVLARMTGARAASFVAGILFAIHPLHVESVSWVSGRKDVLSGLFWLLGMAAYAAYAKGPTRARYTAVALLFICAFMAKPVAVTFPAALLLLDFWPLARMTQGGGADGRRAAFALLVEKIPLFALAFLFSAITFLVQRSGGVMNQIEGLGFVERANNAIVAYAKYVSHTFWPVDLMFPYMHAGADRPLWHGAIAGALLIAVTVIGVLLRRRAPSVLFGWLWFLGTLVPTIGLIQVGFQSMADRYMYLPILGLIVLFVWPMMGLLRRPVFRIPIDAASIRANPDRLSLGFLFVAISTGLGILTWQQQRVWRDSEALLSHAAAVEPGNVPARIQLAVIYLRRGDPASAEVRLREAIVLDGGSAPAWSNLGSAFRMRGRSDEALEAFRVALELDPRQPAPVLNLATLLLELGRTNDARQVLEAGAERFPENEEIRSLLDRIQNQPP